MSYYSRAPFSSGRRDLDRAKRYARARERPNIVFDFVVQKHTLRTIIIVPVCTGCCGTIIGPYRSKPPRSPSFHNLRCAGRFTRKSEKISTHFPIQRSQYTDTRYLKFLKFFLATRRRYTCIQYVSMGRAHLPH